MTHTSNRLAELSSQVSETNATLQTAFDRLRSLTASNNTRFDLALSIPEHHRTADEVLIRAQSLLSVLETIEEKDVLIPDSLLDELHSQIVTIKDIATNLANEISTTESDKKNLNINPESFSVMRKNDSAVVQTYAPIIQQMDVKIDQSIDSAYRAINILKSRSLPNLPGLLRAVTEASKKGAEIVQEAAAHSRHIKETDDEVASLKSSAESAKKEIDELLADARKTRDDMVKYEAETSPRIESIRGTAADAHALQEQVDQYQNEFERFQKEIENRISSLHTGNDELSKLTKSLKEKDVEIEKLNQQASNMLRGATVAGLAGEFGNQRDKLNKELSWARWVFYFSIFALALSAIPLAFYVLPIGQILEGITEGKGTTEQTVITFSGVLARLVLLLPGAWFAKFAATRHATLFRLKEHYAYKHSLAASVEGFKRQAKEYEAEIAAATFHELAMLNPATHMDQKSAEARAPNPVLEWLMKKIKATHDGQ